MIDKMNRFSLAAVASLLIAVPGFAQEAEDADEEEETELEEVVVTGSRIAVTTNFDSPVPVTVIDGSQFDNRLYDYASSAVTLLPSAAPTGGGGPIGAQSVNNLRLGSQRTLTTVNGNRFVSSNGYGGGQVDTNNIPTMLIDRVEVINVGGAAVYGSDAVGGVVNYILKDDFEGFSMRYNHNNIFKDVALQKGWSMLFGGNFMDDRGNVTLSVDYTTTEGTRVLDLPESVKCRALGSDSNGAVPGQTFIFPACESFTYFGISPNGTVTFGDILDTPGALNYPVNIFGYPWPGEPQSDYVSFTDDGRLQIATPGTPTDGTLRYRGGDGLNFGLRHDPDAYTRPIEKFNYVMTGRFDVTDRMRVSGSVYVTSYEAIDESTQGFYTTGLFGSPSNTLYLECNNPFLHPDDSAELCANWVQPDFVNGGTLTNSYGNELFAMSKAWGPYYKSLGGEDQDNTDNRVLNLRVEGDFDFANREWDYSAGVTDGMSRRVSSRPDIIKARLFAALDSVRLPDGTIDCRVNTMGRSAYVNGFFADPYMQPGGVVDPSYFLLGEPGDCVPINPFGNGTQMSDEAIDYVGGMVTTRTKTKQQYNFAYISGQLFDLPAGGLSMLVGYEERSESYNFDDSLFDEAYVGEGSGGMTALFGKFETSDRYAELIAPIVSADMGIPFVQEVTLSGAYRQMEHSISGKDNVDSLTVTYRMNDTFGFRYNVQNTVRSPALGEAFQPQFITSYIIDDPCDKSNINGGPAPDNRQANCAAAGITQPFTSTAETASIFVFSGGNPNLETEKAESLNYGLVITPKGIPFTDWEVPGDLRIALDYIEVELEDAIIELNPDEVLSACYDADPGSYPNSFCSQVFRLANGQMDGFNPGSIGVQGGTSNGSRYDYKGYVFELDYTIPTNELIGVGAGTLSYNLKGYREMTDAFQATAASPVVATTGAFSKPRDRFLHQWSWAHDGWFVFLDGVWTGGGKTDFYWDQEAEPEKYIYMDTGRVYPYEMDGYWTFNGGASYRVTDNMTLSTYITNINDDQCSGDDCWLPGYRTPRTFKFGFRYSM